MMTMLVMDHSPSNSPSSAMEALTLPTDRSATLFLCVRSMCVHVSGKMSWITIERPGNHWLSLGACAQGVIMVVCLCMCVSVCLSVVTASFVHFSALSQPFSRFQQRAWRTYTCTLCPYSTFCYAWSHL